MDVCSALFALWIVGAYEITPGSMRVQQLNPDNNEIIELTVPTNDYLSCWEEGIPLRWSRSIDWRRARTSSHSSFPFYMENKRYKQRRIAKEIEDTVYAYHVYPHMAMVPDYFVRYWDLCEAICDYFDVPFNKPTLTKPEEFEALKGTIESSTNAD